MSKFNLVAAVDRLSKPMMLENLDCNKELNLIELKDFISEQGIVQESVSDFIKSSREYLSHGSFPMWARIADKEDENGDGKIDDADKKGYIAKVIAGLYFYMKKDLRNSDEDAFKMVVNNLTKHNIDKNVKSQVEKNAQLAKFVDNVVTNYEDPATKQKLHKYLNAIQDYYLSDLPAKMTESVDKINNPDYAFYVVGKNKIISGWEYREDAKDALEDTPGVDAKVYSKVTLKKLGLDADNDSDWANQADLT